MNNKLIANKLNLILIKGKLDFHFQHFRLIFYKKSKLKSFVLFNK